MERIEIGDVLASWNRPTFLARPGYTLIWLILSCSGRLLILFLLPV